MVAATNPTTQPVPPYNPGDGPPGQPVIGGGDAPLMDPIYNTPAVPGTPTGVEYPGGGDQYQRGDDYNYNDPYYDESGLQTGVGGKLNERVNVGLDPKLIDYTSKVYENSPYANRNYNVQAGQADAHGRTAQENEMSAYQLEKMLNSGSPLMKRAAAQAMAGAGGRGLMNSSIAQGAAMGSMIDRAQPFALQDATSHGRAASETLANKQSAANLNAQLDTQAGIAGMQAGASRDSQLLASELGGREQLLRHTLGMETREDQQKWQDNQNRQSEQFTGGQNRLAEQFQWADNRQQAAERWAEGELQLIMQRTGNREQALSQVAAQIFGNPELTAEEQKAAWASAQRILGGLHDENDAELPATGPASDPGYVAPPLTSSAKGMSTQPYITDQNKKLNRATAQVYASASSPNAAKVTEALPPIL